MNHWYPYPTDKRDTPLRQAQTRTASHSINLRDPRGKSHTNMHLVPAPAVRLMKRRVLSRPGVNSLMSSLAWWITNVASFQVSTAWLDPKKNEREAWGMLLCESGNKLWDSGSCRAKIEMCLKETKMFIQMKEKISCHKNKHIVSLEKLRHELSFQESYV